MSFITLSPMFLPLQVFLLRFLCSVYPLVRSLVRPLGCIVSSFRIQKFSLIFNHVRRVNLSRPVWLSCSLSINFAYTYIVTYVQIIWCWCTVLPGGISSVVAEPYIKFGFWFWNIVTDIANILVRIWCSCSCKKFSKWHCF